MVTEKRSSWLAFRVLVSSLTCTLLRRKNDPISLKAMRPDEGREIIEPFFIFFPELKMVAAF